MRHQSGPQPTRKQGAVVAAAAAVLVGGLASLTGGAVGTAGHRSTAALRPLVGQAASTLLGSGVVAAPSGMFTVGVATSRFSTAAVIGSSLKPGVVAISTRAVRSSGRVLVKFPAVVTAPPPPPPPPPPVSPPPDGNYTFEVVGAGGVPARWNPCDGIRYAIVVPGAPVGWQSDVSNAVAQMQAATRIPFVNVGTYGSAAQVPPSAQLVINWVSVLTAGDQVGLTTYSYYNTPGYKPEIVSARVQLLSRLPGGLGAGERPVLLHELGHAMGLGHTPNAREVMNPLDLGLPTYQGGDLYGLWRLGAAQGCAGFYR